MKIFLIITLIFSVSLVLAVGPELYQKISITNSVSKIEIELKENGTFKPEFGYNLNFENGEWLIIDLHHGSSGFTIAYDSNKNIFVITAYSTIYPAYEVWGPICHKQYDSIADFFQKNSNLNWQKYN